MGPDVRLFLCVLTLRVALLVTLIEGAIICTAGDFAAGDTASVMCYFPHDIAAYDNVYIQYYPYGDSTGPSGTEVLLCKVEDVKASKCRGQPGYVLKKHTRNTLLVEITNVTKKAQGRYMCQFVPPDDSITEMCNLTVQAKTRTDNVDGYRSNISEQEFSPDIKSGSAKTTSIGVFVGVTVTSLLLVVAAIIIAIIVVRYKRRSKNIQLVNFTATDGQTDRRGSGERMGAENSPLMNPYQHDETTRLTPGPVQNQGDQAVVSEDRTRPKQSVESRLSVESFTGLRAENASSSRDVAEVENDSSSLRKHTKPFSSEMRNKERDPAFLLSRLYDILGKTRDED